MQEAAAPSDKALSAAHAGPFSDSAAQAAYHGVTYVVKRY